MLIKATEGWLHIASANPVANNNSRDLRDHGGQYQ
jgi:hypothetical protein